MRDVMPSGTVLEEGGERRGGGWDGCHGGGGSRAGESALTKDCKIALGIEQILSPRSAITRYR